MSSEKTGNASRQSPHVSGISSAVDTANVSRIHKPNHKFNVSESTRDSLTSNLRQSGSHNTWVKENEKGTIGKDSTDIKNSSHSSFKFDLSKPNHGSNKFLQKIASERSIPQPSPADPKSEKQRASVKNLVKSFDTIGRKAKTEPPVKESRPSSTTKDLVKFFDKNKPKEEKVFEAKNRYRSGLGTRLSPSEKGRVAYLNKNHGSTLNKRGRVGLINKTRNRPGWSPAARVGKPNSNQVQTIQNIKPTNIQNASLPGNRTRGRIKQLTQKRVRMKGQLTMKKKKKSAPAAALVPGPAAAASEIVQLDESEKVVPIDEPEDPVEVQEEATIPKVSEKKPSIMSGKHSTVETQHAASVKPKESDMNPRISTPGSHHSNVAETEPDTKKSVVPQSEIPTRQSSASNAPSLVADDDVLEVTQTIPEPEPLHVDEPEVTEEIQESQEEDIKPRPFLPIEADIAFKRRSNTRMFMSAENNNKVKNFIAKLKPHEISMPATARNMDTVSQVSKHSKPAVKKFSQLSVSSQVSFLNREAPQRSNPMSKTPAALRMSTKSRTRTSSRAYVAFEPRNWRSNTVASNVRSLLDPFSYTMSQPFIGFGKLEKTNGSCCPTPKLGAKRKVMNDESFVKKWGFEPREVSVPEFLNKYEPVLGGVDGFVQTDQGQAEAHEEIELLEDAILTAGVDTIRFSPLWSGVNKILLLRIRYVNKKLLDDSTPTMMKLNFFQVAVVSMEQLHSIKSQIPAKLLRAPRGYVMKFLSFYKENKYEDSITRAAVEVVKHLQSRLFRLIKMENQLRAKDEGVILNEEKGWVCQLCDKKKYQIEPEAQKNSQNLPILPRRLQRKLQCKHYYHKGCIDEWLSEHYICPVCNVDVVKPDTKPNLKLRIVLVEFVYYAFFLYPLVGGFVGAGTFLANIILVELVELATLSVSDVMLCYVATQTIFGGFVQAYSLVRYYGKEEYESQIWLLLPTAFCILWSPFLIFVLAGGSELSILGSAWASFSGLILLYLLFALVIAPVLKGFMVYFTWCLGSLTDGLTEGDGCAPKIYAIYWWFCCSPVYFLFFGADDGQDQFDEEEELELLDPFERAERGLEQEPGYKNTRDSRNFSGFTTELAAGDYTGTPSGRDPIGSSSMDDDSDRPLDMDVEEELQDLQNQIKNSPKVDPDGFF